MSDISPNEYFDLGSLQTWKFVDWTSPQYPHGRINVEALNNYLDSFASEAKKHGIHEVTFSFVQLCDIQAFTSGDFENCNQQDSLWMLNHNIAGLQVEGKSFFQYMVDRLHKTDGMKVSIAFGGEASAGNAWRLKDQPSPAVQADMLANWIKNSGITGVDFDMEDKDFAKDPAVARDLAAFFAELHSQLKGSVPITITTLADAGVWGPGGSALQYLLNGRKLTDLFDGLNLMAYNGSYYLNAGQEPPTSWDLITWIEQLQKNTGMTPAECAAFLHIGFNDKIDYSNPGSGAGPLPFDPSKVPSYIKTSGQYAAYILQQLQEALRKHFGDDSISFGTSFFWDSQADYQVNVGPNNECQSPFFHSGFEKDFYNLMNSSKTGEMPVRQMYDTSSDVQSIERKGRIRMNRPEDKDPPKKT